MKVVVSLLLTSLWMVSACVHSSAADALLEQPRFFSLSTANGLAQDTAEALLLDSRGFLYIGTDNGLDRWDGHHVKRIYGPNDELRDASITALFEDSMGGIWISAFGSGVYRLRPESQQLTQVLAAPYVDAPDLIQSATQFSQADHDRVLIALEQQVVRYDVTSQTIEKLFSLPSDAVEAGSFVRDALLLDDTVIIATTDGIYAGYTFGDIRLIDFLPSGQDHMDSLNAKYLLIDSMQRLWIGTVRGLFVLDVTQFRNQLDDAQSKITFELALPEHNIWKMTEYGPSQFWLGTDSGLIAMMVEPQTTQVTSTQLILQPTKGYDPLARKDILDIAVDAQNNVWLGTNFGGALYWATDSLKFNEVRNRQTNRLASPLSDNNVWSIVEDPKQQLWVGTANGLTRLSADLSTSEHFFQKKKYEAYSDAVIENLFVVDDSTLVIQSGFGLYEFDTHSNTRQIVETQSEAEHAIVEGFVWGAAQAKDDAIWFIQDSHAFRYDPDEKTVTQTDITETVSAHTMYGFINAIPQLPDQIWLSVTGKLMSLSHNGQVRTVHELPPEAPTKTAYPNSIAVDKDNVLWIAYTGYGVFGIDADSHTPKFFIDRKYFRGLDSLYSLMIDASNSLWFSSHSGLHRVNADRNYIEHFRYGQEISVSEFNEGANIKRQNGELVFGSPNGIVVFDPADLQQAPEVLASNPFKGTFTQPGMAITDIALATRDLAFSNTTLNDSTIDLNHNDNGLTVSFSNLRFDQTQFIKYRYRLYQQQRLISEGIAHDASLSIPLLEPGHYRFEVEPHDFDPNASDVARLFIRVAPSPWLTWQAKTLYVCLFTGLIATLIYVRRNQILTLDQSRQQVQLFGNAFQQTRDWVIIFDENRHPIATNEAFSRAFGLKPHDSVTDQYAQFNQRYADLMARTQEILLSLSPDEFKRKETSVKIADGRSHDILINFTAVARKGDANTISHYLMVISDISEQKRAERKLRKMATVDHLTGLVNRTLMIDRLQHAVASAARNGHKVAVLFVDLDRFKGINDSLGHDYGDQLLRVVAKRMQALARSDDTVARIGGDEFVMILEATKQVDDISRLIDQLIERIEKPIQVRDEVLRVSCSVGVAVYPDDSEDTAELLRFSDVAMYSAKRDPVNRFAFFTDSMNIRAQYRLSLENLVKHAYQGQHFYNVYQPIVDLNTQRTVGMELLLRCNLDERPISPAEFIPVLEEMRLILDVTKQSLSTAVADLADWYAQGYRGYLSVNLSALHFTSTFDTQYLTQLLDRFNLPLSALRFEVTEGILMEDKETALIQFETIKQAGFLLALDDFGTGYSSLSYLQLFPLDVLKIDKSFCDGIGQTHGDNLIKTTIGMARNLGLDCIAEGVETQQQVEFLHANGCTKLQGYFYSKPVDADAAKILSSVDWSTQTGHQTST
ncbi:EAL domain-containing protein [Alteromonas oceanisediminis]|uniref:EAL domain-containing protein n=1 Tax=Alteromonas oceanisediminis TaxID=2836180 RepID=UPI001BD94397|nr:EAL domain-containing protein [Alteromonas oceanisediminis]MBT0586208.1 EAL domain-containing protein [Alteromonas oceanisediminis]